MDDLLPTHNPLVLGRDVMEPDTVNALQELMDAHESNPCVQFSVYPTDKHPVMSMPNIHYTFPKGFINIGPKKAQEFLDSRLLADVFLQVSSDATLRHVPTGLDFDSNKTAFRYAMKSIDMLVMPNLIMMRHCHSKLKDVAEAIIGDELPTSDRAFYNFGVFLVPAFETAHETLERTSLLQSLKHVWRHSLDETAQTLQDQIEIAEPKATMDPEIQLLTAGDRLRMMFGKPPRRGKT